MVKGGALQRQTWVDSQRRRREERRGKVERNREEERRGRKDRGGGRKRGGKGRVCYLRRKIKSFKYSKPEIFLKPALP